MDICHPRVSESTQYAEEPISSPIPRLASLLSAGPSVPSASRCRSSPSKPTYVLRGYSQVYHEMPATRRRAAYKQVYSKQTRSGLPTVITRFGRGLVWLVHQGTWAQTHLYSFIAFLGYGSDPLCIEDTHY